MIVVADSSPLHYLILIGEADLLRQLYAEVTIPDAVAEELSRHAAPPEVSVWMSQLPTWVRVVTVNPEEMASVRKALGPGERAAISLAERLNADLLLMDETAGRAEAVRRNLRVTGILGVLRTAAEKGLVDVPGLLRRLQATTFYVDEDLLHSVFGSWLKE